MNRKLVISILVIVGFILAYKVLVLLKFFGISLDTRTARLFTYHGFGLTLVLFVSALLFGKQNALAALGLSKELIKGMGYGLLFTLPMFLGYAVIGQLSSGWTLLSILGVFVGAAMEEIVFRGFLFGHLFRKAGWGFVPAVLLNAVIFGIGHLYQGNSFEETIGVFFVTLMGGIWFAWIYVEWNYNLWVSIGLHFFMNLSWYLFSIGENALGGWGANFFRIMTILFSIVFTILLQQQKGFRIMRSNLFFNKNED